MGTMLSCVQTRTTARRERQRLREFSRRRPRPYRPTISRPIFERTLIERMEPTFRAPDPPGPANVSPDGIIDDPAEHVVVARPVNNQPGLPQIIARMSPPPGPSRRRPPHMGAMPIVDRRERDREEFGRIRRRRQIDRELDRMRQELNRPHHSLRHDFFGDSKPSTVDSLESFNSFGEKQLDILAELPPAVIKRVVRCLEPNEFIRMEATCRDMKAYCTEDDNWRPNQARGIFYKQDRCVVMRSPYEDELQTLQTINTFRYRLTVLYMCIWGNITDAKLSEIRAILLTNGCKIRQLNFGPVGFSETEDDEPEDTSVEAAPERLNDFAEAFGIDEVTFSPNCEFSVETYTTARMGRVIRKMHLPSLKTIDYRQLLRMKFETLTCSMPIQPFDLMRIIPLIQEWHNDQRDIKFISISTPLNSQIDKERALHVMSEDINIRGGPLWQTYYENAETGEFFPLKWADPSTKDSAWIFVHERKKPILYLFLVDHKIILGSIQGFIENGCKLPASILMRSIEMAPDFRSDINERSQFQARARQIALIDHAVVVHRDDRIPFRRRHRAPPRNDERRAANPLNDPVRIYQRPGDPRPVAPMLRFPPFFIGHMPPPMGRGPEEEEAQILHEPAAGEAERAHARAQAFGVAFMENNLVEDPEDRIRSIWERLRDEDEEIWIDEEDIAEGPGSGDEAMEEPEAGEVNVDPRRFQP